MGDVDTYTIATYTTAPTDANTVTLFNSVTAFGTGGFRHNRPARISFAVNNSHTGTLNAARSINGGTTWTTFDSRAVAVPAANTISGPYDYLVDTYEDFRLQWVNGGTTQTTWTPELHGHNDRQPGT